MLECRIEGKNDGKSFPITDGAVFIENYNEALDSGTIIIPQLSEEIDIEPFDVIVISGYGNSEMRFCVDSFSCIQTSIAPPIFQYEVSLFSETKLLETILCPNLSITKLMGESPRSVASYIIRYIYLYSPKTNSSPTLGPYGLKFTVSSETAQRFSNIACPEMQWNQPTLREVLNDLMMVDNCIPILRNNVLYHLDIGAVGSEISSEQKRYINYIRKSQSSADYVSEIKMDLVNSANNSTPVEGILPNDITRIVERIGFRNSDEYILTTDNMRLQTSYPIWKLFELEMRGTFTRKIVYHCSIPGSALPDIEVQKTATIDIPLGNYVLEQGEWKTKDIYYDAFGNTQPLSTDYQNTCLYYTRGAKNIHNFNNKQSNSVFFIPQQVSVFELILRSDAVKNVFLSIAEDENPDPTMYDTIDIQYVPGASDPSFKDVTFSASYETIDQCVFRVSKIPFPTNLRHILDNQTNSYVDLNRLGNLEYSKARRLGNSICLVNARFPFDPSLIPSLSQMVNGKIIYQRQISIYKDHIDVNMLSTDNYVLKDYFTGVRSKIRSWKIVDGSEALTRSELIKYYINDEMDSISNERFIIPVFSSLDEYLEKFNHCIAWFIMNDNSRRPEKPKYAGQEIDFETAIILEFTKHRIGNSVVFTLHMQDNAFAGTYVSDFNRPSWQGGGVEQKPIKYTDSNGEASVMHICFYENFDPEQFQYDYLNRALKPLAKVPSRIENMPIFYTSLDILKDNKEIMQVSIQFEFNEGANDIFIGRK